jgi:DNA replication protein DnaC
MLEQTKSMLAQMKMNGILEGLDLRLAEATSHNWGHSDFLSAIVTDEKNHRDNKQVKRRIKAARFRTDACYEKIDTTAKRSLTSTQVRDLMELRFLHEPRNVLIHGPTGVGKTFLATALGNQACRKGFTSIFMGLNELIDRVDVARADGSYLRLRDRFIKTDCLILDDLGIKKLPAIVVQDLYDILEERFSNKSTIITSQIPIENWKEVIEDPVALEAILDRLVHGAIRLNLSGESMRKKRSQEQRLDKH